MYQLVNEINCEIIDPASPNLVCRFFMGFNETVHFDSLRISNMYSNKFKQACLCNGWCSCSIFSPQIASYPTDYNQTWCLRVVCIVEREMTTLSDPIVLIIIRSHMKFNNNFIFIL